MDLSTIGKQKYLDCKEGGVRVIFSKVNKLLNKYAVCPQCGSEQITKKDSIRIGDKTFSRSCGCGFSITVDENDNEIKED